MEHKLEPEVIAEVIHTMMYMSPALRQRWLKAAKEEKTLPNIYLTEALRAAIHATEAEAQAAEARRSGLRPDPTPSLGKDRE